MQELFSNVCGWIFREDGTCGYEAMYGNFPFIFFQNVVNDYSQQSIPVLDIHYIGIRQCDVLQEVRYVIEWMGP